MKKSTSNQKTLINLHRKIYSRPRKVVLSGSKLSIPQILEISRGNANVEFDKDPKIQKKIQTCYEHMYDDIKNGVPVYGGNTGYGARASNVVNEGAKEKRIEQAKKVSDGIAHIDVTVGPSFNAEVTRGAMLIRINALMQGISAIKLADLDIYRKMLNARITPIVNQYGGIGASGDLAHNCRILSAARQLPTAKVWKSDGEVASAKDALEQAGIPKLILDPKAGLGFVNGDNFSTSLATLLFIDTMDILILSNIIGAMAIEVLKGTDRSFHPLLAAIRPHEGQKEVADLFRFLLDGSKLAYQEMKGHVLRPKGVKVQDGYSLRCLSQFHAVNFDKIKSYYDIIETNANSVSDNPLWVPPEFATKGEKPWQWVSGGNFIAMQMVEVMDGLRKTLTQIVKLNDRHLARLVNPHENNGLPANLSHEKAITHCAFKGVQIQSGMLEVYSSLLSIPVSTFFGTHEEGNQDITAHSLTSGIIGLENLRLARYSTAQNLLAVCQGVDLRGGGKLLSPKTRPVYEFVRNMLPNMVEEERPLNVEIETIYDSIVTGKLNELLNEKILNDFES